MENQSRNKCAQIDTIRRGSVISKSNLLLFCLLPVLLYLIIFFLYPLFTILFTSVSEPEIGFHNYMRALTKTVYFKVILNTLRISLVVTCCCLIMGYPVAYLLANAIPAIQQILIIFVLLPFCTSLLVRTYAWMVLLQTNGVINQVLMKMGIIREPLAMMYNFIGVVVGMTHILLPFMVLPIFGVMKGIDQHYVTVARSFGASAFQAFRRIYLPHTAPGIVAGSFLVFIQAIGYFITPALLGGRKEIMIAMLIDSQINYLLNWGFGSALAVILFATITITCMLYIKLRGLKESWKAIA